MGLYNATHVKELNGLIESRRSKTFTNYQPVLAPLVEDLTTPSQIIYDISTAGTMQMVEWEGPRKHRNVRILDNGAYKRVTPYEVTIDINKYDYNEGLINKIGGDINSAINALVSHKDIRAAAALLNGTCTHSQYLGFDSKAIFATDHNLSGASQSNLMTGSLDATNLGDYIEAMTAWVDDQGMPVNIDVTNIYLVVPPQLRYTAQALITPTLQYGGTNVLANAVKLIVAPLLGREPTNWYLMAPINGVAPINHYTLAGSEEPFVARMASDDPLVFETNNYSFGASVATHTFISNWFQVLKSAPGGSTYSGNTIAKDLLATVAKFGG